MSLEPLLPKPKGSRSMIGLGHTYYPISCPGKFGAYVTVDVQGYGTMILVIIEADVL